MTLRSKGTESLRARVFTLLFVAAVLPVLVVTGLQLHRERDLRLEANVAVMRARLDEVGSLLAMLNTSHAQAARREAADREVVRFCEATAADRARGLDALLRRLEAFWADDPAVLGLGVVDARGDVIASTLRPLIGAELVYREYFQRALAGAESLPDVYVSHPAAGQVPIIPYAAPVRASDGRIIGVFALWLRASRVWDLMRAANDQAGPGSFYVLFDRSGLRIGHSANATLLLRPAAPLAPEVAARLREGRRFGEQTADLLTRVEPFPLEALAHDEVFRRFSPTNRTWNLGVSRALPELGWTLVALAPERLLEVPPAQVLWSVLPAAFLGLGIALVGGVLIMRKVVRPIRALALAATALERGEFQLDARAGLDLPANDEVRALAEAFQAMAAALADRDRALRERNRDLKQILDAVGQGLVGVTPTGELSPERSTILTTWFGEPRAGERIWSYLCRDDRYLAAALERAWHALGSAERESLGEHLRALPDRLHLGERTFSVEYRPVGEARLERVIVIVSEVTAAMAREANEQQLELELRQAQKLEAVGRLASGIAHEINTPIQFIGDNTRFLEGAVRELTGLLARARAALASPGVPAALREELERAAADADLPYITEQAPDAVAKALEGVRRVATIVRALKEFAHPDRGEMVACDLNRSLQVTLDIARNEYKYVATVETDLGALPLVVCRPGELNQVWLNLLVNAAHAIEAVVKDSGRKGTIRVTTRRVGGDVVVAFRDSGCGVSPEIRDKVFDPFFTTKPLGKGTGQGLAIARSVVLKHGGTLTFDTTVGVGTTFTVRLPVEPRPSSALGSSPLTVPETRAG